MKKRIIKKRELEERLLAAEMHIGYLLDQNKQLWSVIEQNAKATNKELDKLHKEIHKKPKKGFMKGWS